MADITIRIRLNGSVLSFLDDATGGIAVAKRVSPGDKLRWTCEEGPFFVLFAGNKSPFIPKQMSFSGAAGGFSSKGTVKRLGMRATEVFKYSAGVMGGTRLVEVDPDVIVDDPGGGGGRKRAAAKKRAPAKRAGR